MAVYKISWEHDDVSLLHFGSNETTHMVQFTAFILIIQVDDHSNLSVVLFVLITVLQILTAGGVL